MARYGFLWLFMGLWLFSPLPSQAEKQTYTVQRFEGKYPVATLRGYNTVTRKVVWKRTFSGVHRLPVWSADHRAFAILVQNNPKSDLNYDALLVWKVGQPLRLLPLHTLYQDWDGVLDMSWSPDKKRLLIRAFYSGGGDINAGQLLCYVLARKRFYQGPVGVRVAWWAANRQVRYRKLAYVPIYKGANDLRFFAAKTVRRWHCP